MRNIPEFDGLRGYLSTVIVVGHIYYPAVVWGLGIMDLFFTLSAYLISSGIIRNQNNPGFYKIYIKRRILRIWPNYYIFLLICTLIAILGYKYGDNKHFWFPIPESIQNILFLQNVEGWFCFSDQNCRHLHYPIYSTHSWSLALEEQFYVLVLLIVWIISKLEMPVFASIILAVCSATLGLTLRYWGTSGWTLPGRFDAFSAGICLAFVMSSARNLHFDKHKFRAIVFTLLIISFIPIIILYSISLPKIRGDFPEAILILVPSLFSVLGFFLFAFVELNTKKAFLAFLRWKLWVGLGKMSYSTYLWHFPIIVIFQILSAKLNISLSLPIYVIELLTIFTVSRFMYVIIEKPMRRLGNSPASH